MEVSMSSPMISDLRIKNGKGYNMYKPVNYLINSHRSESIPHACVRKITEDVVPELTHQQQCQKHSS